MRLKLVAKRIVPPIILDVIRAGKSCHSSDPIKEYLQGGKVPWTRGYDKFKAQLIKNTLADKTMLDRFSGDGELPDGFGLGIDERCIEYPWLLANLPNDIGNFLDAGSALNHKCVIDYFRPRCNEFHILTLAPESACLWYKGISYLFQDLRNIPVRDNYYDIIACISTLEHVGLNNTLYSPNASHSESRTEDFILVMRELRRVLKPQGKLLMTVPFGLYENFSTFQQFDGELLNCVIESFGEISAVTKSFYRYSAAGWNMASAEDCAQCRYVEWINRPRSEWPNPTPVESDMAAASRAVVCVQLTKT